MKVQKKTAIHFNDFIFDWDYETYLLVGGYGSGKSYHIAFKLILKLFQEKRKVLVVREVYETIKDSCYDLISEILLEMNMLTDDHNAWAKHKNKVLALKSPLQFKFPNGSVIVFKGMDKPFKVKSINGISIVWLEECAEIKEQGYKELLGRVRVPNQSMHFILSTNPISRESWVYKRFFVNQDKNGKPVVIVGEKKFYDQRVLINNGIYYHHSTADDNPFLSWRYIKRLDDLKNYDYPLYMVARLGMFGATGTRVLPQIKIAQHSKDFKEGINRLPLSAHYFGFDFGFEESFNAIVCCAVDIERSILYIYDEVYKNHLTDSQFASDKDFNRVVDRIKEYNQTGANKMLVADSSDPKAIAYYRQKGVPIRPCVNRFTGSRLSNTRKIKRFKRIYISPKCVNTIRELRDLTYKKTNNGATIYDEFNIDPHTFSGLWYALDMVTVADLKQDIRNSKRG